MWSRLMKPESDVPLADPQALTVQRQQELRAVTQQFEIPGEYVCAELLGGGHINETWCMTAEQDGRRVRYVLQRINARVFHNPRGVMENVQRVTTHLAGKLAGQPDIHRRVLTLVPARNGDAWHQDQDGDYWRASLFIERTQSCDVAKTAEQACQAARAFGRFQRLLSDLPAPRLHDTIPDFHNTPMRFTALERAIETDHLNRASLAKPEIEFVLKRASIANELLEAGLLERVTHNDAKLNNVLMDAATGEGLCVIDLDTVMPGLAPYDFGDLVRTTTSPGAEDERDLSKVALQLPLYESVLRGYTEETRGFLTPAERQHLAASSKLITFETGLRFLTDFLEGDTYFRIHREGHNLNRCRTQLKLVESIEQQEEEMTRLVEKLG